MAWAGTCVVGALSSGEGQLQCHSGCTGVLRDLNSICTDYSSVDNWRAGEMTYTYDIGTSVANFEAS